MESGIGIGHHSLRLSLLFTVLSTAVYSSEHPTLPSTSSFAQSKENWVSNFKSGSPNSWDGEERLFDTLKEKRQFSVWGGKRGFPRRLNLNDALRSEFEDEALKRAAFNSWAGKRRVVFENDQNKRAAFNSWAGKREQAKKAAFSSWAGKRQARLNNGVHKRASFSAWAGKRAEDSDSDFAKGKIFGSRILKKMYDPEMEMARRAAFSSWAGKRQGDGSLTELDVLDYPREAVLPALRRKKRAAFNSWAGKRDFLLSQPDLKHATLNLHHGSEMKNPAEKEPIEMHVVAKPEEAASNDKKRQAFNSWAGKRKMFSEQHDDVKRAPFASWAGKRQFEDTEKESMKRAAFNSWAGKRKFESGQEDNDKRAAFNSWAGKRDSTRPGKNPKRAAFSSWAGKRKQKPEGDMEKRPAFSSWSGKRDQISNAAASKKAAFNSWAGKRNEIKEDTDAVDHSFHDNTDTDKEVTKGTPKKETDKAGFKMHRNKITKRAAFNSWAGKRSKLASKLAGMSNTVDNIPANSEKADTGFTKSFTGAEFPLSLFETYDHGRNDETDDMVEIPGREMTDDVTKRSDSLPPALYVNSLNQLSTALNKFLGNADWQRSRRRGVGQKYTVIVPAVNRRLSKSVRASFAPWAG